ncbi:MAG TPA: hypothetical protein VMW24_19275 [Sedimentisphaerales bacterium]|nr:hypothetical protein [Sedimentisphaerales bacterium]
MATIFTTRASGKASATATWFIPLNAGATPTACTVVPGTEYVNAVGHGLATEDVIGFTAATMPTSAPEVVTNTTYYARRIDDDNITVHPTAADATANTNIIDFTSTGTTVKLWKAAAAAPATGDTIGSCADPLHSVEWDLKLGAISVLLWNGTMWASTGAGSTMAAPFGFTLAASMTGSGWIIATSDGTATGGVYPITAWFTIACGAFSIPATILKCLKCFEPDHRWVYLKNQEAINATVLETALNPDGSGGAVDLTAGNDATTWVADAVIRVDDINEGRDTEALVIASVDGTAVTVDVPGLVAQKEVGAVMALVSRNIVITGTASAFLVCGDAGANQVVNAEINGTGGAATSRIFSAGTDYPIGGVCHSAGYLASGSNFICSGIILNITYGFRDTRHVTLTSSCLYSGSGTPFSTVGNSCEGAIVHGRISGCNTAIQGSAAGFTLGPTGVINGCGTGILNTSNTSVCGTISNCTTGISGGSGKLLGATLTGNTTDIAHNNGEWIGYGATLGGTTQVGSIYSSPTGHQQVVMHDIGGVAGALKAWMYGSNSAAGGIVNNDAPPDDAGAGTFASVLPNAKCYTFNCTSVTYPAYLDFPIRRVKNQAITITARMRQLVAGMTERPTVQLIDPEDDPFFGGTALATETVTDDALWQTLTINYNPVDATNYDRELIVRLRATETGAVMYGGMTVETAGSGGGAVRIGVGGRLG